MVSRSIEIALVVGTLIAVQTLVAAGPADASDQAEPADASDQTEPADTSDQAEPADTSDQTGPADASDQAEPADASDPESELIVVAAASGASDPDDLAARQPSRVDSGPPTLGAQPLALYQPPRRGAPARDRVGAGITRGATAQPTPLALAPDHVGLTVSASPSLFWHIDAVPGKGVALIFTITDDTSVTPLAEVGLDAPSGAGIQRLRLADHGIKLDPEVEYMWSIALVADADKRSEDVVSTSFIRRVARPEALAVESEMASTSPRRASGTTPSKP